MAVIFDQYDSIEGSHRTAGSIFGTTTFLNLKLEEDMPMFSRSRVNFCPPHPVTHLVAGNGHLILAMGNKTLIRINMNQPNNMEEVDISKYALQAKLSNIFIDPSGNHLLISVASRDATSPVDLLYLPWTLSKPKSTNKLRGHLVSVVAWNYRNQSDHLTGPILIGTSQGVIFEIELSLDDKAHSSFELYCKQLYDFGRDEGCIMGLEIIRSPSHELRYQILCATKNNMYIFDGYVKGADEQPFYASVFQKYNITPVKSVIKLDNNWSSSWLQTFLSPAVPSGSRIFAWMVEQGVYTGELTWPIESHAEGPAATVKLLKYPENISNNLLGCGLVVTEYHILIVWPDRLQGICTLNGQVVFEESLQEDSGKIMGIYRDVRKGIIWLFTERAIFRYKLDRENRNIWRVYLDQGNYEQAKQHCGSNISRLSVVLLKEAEDLFEKNDFIKSAKLFSKTLSSLEEVSLRFMQAEQEEALQVYLLEKLDAIKPNEQMQLTMLVMWLLELHLKKLGTLRDAEGQHGESYLHSTDAFHMFLGDEKVQKCLNGSSAAVYDIILSHNDHETYVHVGLLLNDHDRVVRHLMDHGRHLEALAILTKKGSEKLFYQHAACLLQIIPSDTINAFIALGKRLSAVRLLPGLVNAHTSHGHGKEVIIYLEFAINKLEVTDQVLHNFLITLYANLCKENLLPFLKMQGNDSSAVHYDLKFALRECQSVGEDYACVHILTTMGLYQDAVELALKLDTNLAKATANRPREDPDLMKKLWVMIASHVVQQEKDVARAMDILRECDLLKLEDILPLFPDFVKIDQFKDAICHSLQEYNHHIDSLKQEMENANQAVSNIRQEVQKLKQRSHRIAPGDVCLECQYQLLSKPFYVFPCEHKFHQDCLADAIMNYLSEVKQKTVSELKGRLLAISANEEDTRPSLWAEREVIRKELDTILATDCLYCGELMVSHIDTPFIKDTDWDSSLAEWE